MSHERFSSIFTLAVVLNCLLIGSAFAGFGFGGADLGKSGLDFTKGYDINTVTTVSGRVVAAPWTGEKEQVFVDIKAGGGIVSLSIGPKSSWESRQMPLNLNDDIVAKGSKAQGKDGKTYLLVQKLTNRTTGAHMAVRTERGGTEWPGRSAGGMMGGGPGGGMMGGGPGGGMMRGTGGGMRR